MSYNPNLPITASNCHTRAMLERPPGKSTLGPRATKRKNRAKKAASHANNLVARALNKGRPAR